MTLIAADEGVHGKRRRCETARRAFDRLALVAVSGDVLRAHSGAPLKGTQATVV